MGSSGKEAQVRVRPSRTRTLGRKEDAHMPSMARGCFSSDAMVLGRRDVLDNLFRCNAASERIIEWLFVLRLVSKTWRAAIDCVVIDEVWLSDFRSSAAAWACSIPVLLTEMKALASTEQPGDPKFGEYMGQMQMYLYDEPTQYSALVGLATIIVPEFRGTPPPQAVTVAAINKCYTEHMPVVSRVVKKHGTHERIQLQACALIEAFATHKAAIVPLMQADAISQLVDMLKRDGVSCGVADVAVRALRNMLHWHTLWRGGQNKCGEAVVVKAHAIPVVLRQMQTHAAEEYFFTTSTEFLGCLAYRWVEELVECGVDTVLYDCMRMFPDRSGMQLSGIRTLHQLVNSGKRDNMDFFGASRGMEVIFAALRATPFTHETDASGMRLLRSLLQNSRKFGDSLSGGGAERDTNLAMRMVACGLVPLVLRVLGEGLVQFKPDPANYHQRLQVQTVCMSILRTLTASGAHLAQQPNHQQAARHAVLSAGVIAVVQTVQTSMVFFPGNRGLQTDSCYVLQEVCQPNGQTRQVSVPPRVVGLVKLALGRCGSDREMLEAGVGAIHSFLQSRCNVRACCEQRVGDVLLPIMHSNTNTNGLSSSADSQRHIALLGSAMLVRLAAFGDDSNLAHMQMSGVSTSSSLGTVHYSVVSLMVQILATHAENRPIVRQALKTLSFFVVARPHLLPYNNGPEGYDHPGAKKGMHAIFRDNGGVQVVTSALALHRHDASCKRVALRILQACS